MSDLKPNDEESKQRQVAVILARGLTPSERLALAAYVGTLSRIRASNAHPMVKAKDAWAATLDSEVVWPVARSILEEVKRHAWDERGLKGRAGLASSVAALAVFGSQGAGIAALGGAIGVPLWLVFGAGGAFLAGLYEELHGNDAPPPVKQAGRSGQRSRSTVLADVVDVEVRTVEVEPLRLPSARGKPAGRKTVISGDSVDCSECGHSRKITEHWLEELRKRRPEMFISGRLALTEAAAFRLVCASCGSKSLVVNRPNQGN